VYPLCATFEKHFGGIDKVPYHLLHPAAQYTVYSRKGQFSTLVEIVCDDGHIGYGECYGLPNAIYTAGYIKEIFAPILIDRDPLDIFRHWNDMMHVASGMGNSSGPMLEAVSGIDIALWDLKGKILDVPVYQLLGGKVNDSIYCYGTPVTLFETVEQTRARTKELLDMGFTAIKLKLGRGIETDLLHLDTVRSTAGPDVKILIDFNCAYEGKIQQAIELARQAEKYNIFWFEEPIRQDNYDGFKMIREKINIPIAAGENTVTPTAFKHLIDTGHVDIIMPNVGRCCGITGMYKVSTYAGFKNIQVAPHGVGTEICISAAAHAMTTFNNFLIFEYELLFNPLRNKILKNKLCYADSYINLTGRPGLDVDINWDTVAEYVPDGWPKAYPKQ
jgi:L-alanine-DL-glutamate epimerase-like enolase superfamily enzyme